MRIVSLAFDFAGNPRSRAVTEMKLARDGRTGSEVFFLVCGGKNERFELSPTLRGVLFRPLFRFRPVCDVQLAMRAPSILRLASFKPEEIVISDFPLILAAMRVRRICGGKIVLHLGGLPSQLAATRGVMHRLYHSLIERLLWRYVDRYIAINESTRTYLLQLGIPQDRITVHFPDTISLDLPLIQKIKKGEARKRFGIGETERLVLSAGRLEPEKAFDELIETFVQSNIDARLVIAGEGRLGSSLELLIKRLGAESCVQLVGQQDRQALWQLYADADAFVLLSRSEALGMVIWEAMYMGVPVVGRPIGGIKESIKTNGERGFFWNSNDGPKKFREILERSFSADATVLAMKDRAKRYVTKQLSL